MDPASTLRAFQLAAASLSELVTQQSVHIVSLTTENNVLRAQITDLQSTITSLNSFLGNRNVSTNSNGISEPGSVIVGSQTFQCMFDRGNAACVDEKSKAQGNPSTARGDVNLLQNIAAAVAPTISSRDCDRSKEEKSEISACGPTSTQHGSAAPAVTPMPPHLRSAETSSGVTSSTQVLPNSNTTMAHNAIPSTPKNSLPGSHDRQQTCHARAEVDEDDVVQHYQFNTTTLRQSLLDLCTFDDPSSHVNDGSGSHDSGMENADAKNLSGGKHDSHSALTENRFGTHNLDQNDNESVLYCSVVFKRDRTFCFTAKEQYLVGQRVVVSADRGSEDIGTVRSITTTLLSHMRIRGHVVRAATASDIETQGILLKDIEPRCIEIATVLSAQHQLPLKIVDATVQLDRKKITFFYSCSNRVDFRELVAELHHMLQARIWMEKVI